MRWWYWVEGVIDWKILGGVLVAVLMVFSVLLRERDAVFECQKEYSYCTVTSTNSLNISTTHKILMPYEITGAVEESYVQSRSRGRYRHHSMRKYNVFVMNKSGRKVKVFYNISSNNDAKRLGKEITECIRNKAYPCVVKR